MTTNQDIQLRFLLEKCIEEAHSEIGVEQALVDEILPKIGIELHSIDHVEDIFERNLVEQTIARVRHEVTQLDDGLKHQFQNLPNSIIGNLYISDIDGSKRYLEREEWKQIKNYCRVYTIVDRLIPLFNMVSELINIRTAELISRNVFGDEYGGRSGVNWILENEPISASHRPEMLKRCDVFDHELVEDIKEVKDLRNSLVHDLNEMRQVEDPESLLTQMERSISVIERIDEKVSYPSLVRVHEEQELEEAFNINLDRVRGNLEDATFDSALEAVEDELMETAFRDEESVQHSILKEKLDNDEFLLDAFERFYRNDLKGVDDTEEKMELLIQYGVATSKYFDVNLFRRLKPYQERFQSRLPGKIFSENFIELFDDLDDD